MAHVCLCSRRARTWRPHVTLSATATRCALARTRATAELRAMRGRNVLSTSTSSSSCTQLTTPHRRAAHGMAAAERRQPARLLAVGAGQHPADTSLDVDALAPPQQLPLHNKRILITAPRQYASKLAGLLITAGAQPVWLPGVAVSRLCEQRHLQQLDAALQQLRSFTHLAFTSKNGILAVLQRLEQLHGGPAAAAAHVSASGVKLCALGADGQVLQHAGLAVHVSPAEASTAGLVAELAARGEAQGARVLCPVPHVTGGLVEPLVVPRFLAALAAAGAQPVRVPAYLTAPGLPGPQCCAGEAALLQQGHIHAIAFSSTAEAQGLCSLLGGRDALAAAVQQHGVVLAAHGPYTAAGAADVLGLQVPVVSRDFSSFEGLVRALGSALRSSSGSSEHAAAA